MKRKDHPDLFSDAPIDYRKSINPARTAMHRKTPSPIARALLDTKFLDIHGIRTILDYGCGVGRDVEYYREHGLQAEGYDPYKPFGWTTVPTGTFDLIVNLFVFNVIADVSERRALAETLTDRMRPGGFLAVATRSPAAITAEAKKKNWTPYGDGYLSSPSRGTFQKGISKSELADYFSQKHLETFDVAIPVTADVICVVLRRSPVISG